MILVCGEALYDVFMTKVPEAGPVGLTAVIGGSPLNVAVGLARLGRPAGFFAGVSTDPLGERLARHIAAEGIETRYLRRLDNPTTLSLVGVDAAGAPRYTFHGHRAADISLTQADLPALGPEVLGLHVGSYTLVRPPVADALAALVRREHQRLVSLDPNIRPTVEPDMAVWRARIAALLPLVSVVKASDEDIGLLHPGEAPESVAARWLAEGPGLVVVTRGAAGAFGLTRAGRVDVAAPRVAVVDTVGAGDTFQAALIDGLLARGPGGRAAVAGIASDELERLLRRCVAAAAITCGRQGADLPRAAELAG